MQCYGLSMIAPLASRNPDAEHALADEPSRANQPARARDECHTLLDLQWQFLPGTQAIAIPTGTTAKYFTSEEKSAAIGNGACKSVATETFSRSPETIPGPRLMLAETSPMDSMNSIHEQRSRVFCWP